MSVSSMSVTGDQVNCHNTTTNVPITFTLMSWDELCKAVREMRSEYMVQCLKLINTYNCFNTNFICNGPVIFCQCGIN